LNIKLLFYFCFLAPAATVQVLLSENNEIPCHLSSLCIFEVNAMWIKKLKTIVESKKMPR
jgi:hypothetical protein